MWLRLCRARFLVTFVVCVLRVLRVLRGFVVNLRGTLGEISPPARQVSEPQGSVGGLRQRFDNLRINLLVAKRRRHMQGICDRLGITRPVPDDTNAVDSQQWSTTGFIVNETLAHLLEEPLSQFSLTAQVLQDILRDGAHHHVGHAFAHFEHDISDKTFADQDIGLP